MKIPVHRLHVYQKPLVGTQFIRAYPAMRYKHKISVYGGCTTASCNLMLSRPEAEYALENYIGNRVAVYVDNPAVPIWEGMVNRISINLPGLVLTSGMDEMGNRVDASYRTVSNTEVPLTASPVNNTDSQALYGIKEKVLRLAAWTGVPGTDSYITALQNTILALQAYPMSSAAPSSGSPSTIVEVELVGFYQALEWEPTFSPNNGGSFFQSAAAPSFSFVSLNLANMVNGDAFISDSDFSLLEDNSAIYDQAQDHAATMWQQLKMIAECGNNSTPERWIIGVAPADFNNSTRRLYYRAASTDVKYTARANDGARIRTPSGALVPPWTVTPDGVLKLSDALVGWQGSGNDPRSVYLLDISYDAENQRVTWASDDSIEMQGALQVRKVHTSSDMQYGQRAYNPMM